MAISLLRCFFCIVLFASLGDDAPNGMLFYLNGKEENLYRAMEKSSDEYTAVIFTSIVCIHCPKTIVAMRKLQKEKFPIHPIWVYLNDRDNPLEKVCEDAKRKGIFDKTAHDVPFASPNCLYKKYRGNTKEIVLPLTIVIMECIDLAGKAHVDNRADTIQRGYAKYGESLAKGRRGFESRIGSLLNSAASLWAKGSKKQAAQVLHPLASEIRESPFWSVELADQYSDLAEKVDLDRLSMTKTIGGMEFVYIRGGSFLMGSPEGVGNPNERPLHRVEVSGFWMGKYEVTQGEYESIMDTNPSIFKGDSRRPVENVSWHDAKEFCEKFGKKYGVPARLPYEAEWEYAARAGTSTAYYWGDTIDGNYCWYVGNSNGTTHPVGEKRPNAWGLYDMAGNVREWCEDWYDATYYSRSPKKNPMGPETESYRVLRGGSWYYIDYSMRSALRFRNFPGIRYFYYGFRVIVVASP